MPLFFMKVMSSLLVAGEHLHCLVCDFTSKVTVKGWNQTLFPALQYRLGGPKEIPTSVHLYTVLQLWFMYGDFGSHTDDNISFVRQYLKSDFTG
jgi:hypothetical protein